MPKLQYLKKLIPLLFILLFLVSQAIYGQQNATLYGTIKDSTGRPVNKVLIGLLGGEQKTTLTDSTGHYNYEVPSGKEINVFYFHESYLSKSISVELKPGERKELSFGLQPSPTISIDTFSVIGRSHNMQGMKEINPLLVSHIPMPNEDFNSILLTQPGVGSRTELGSEYSVRGGGYDENLVYVNGIEVYRPQLIREGEQEGLSFVNPDMVSSVLFSAGGWEAKYGDKLSSVLDVTYKKPTSFSGSASGSLLGGSLHLEGVTDSNKHFTYLVGARFKSNQYLLNSLDVQGDYKPLFADLQMFLTYTPCKKLEFNFLTTASLNEYNFVPQTQTSTFGTISQV
jgi:hypothetical protein